MRMYAFLHPYHQRSLQTHGASLQTTEDVNEAIKKGLPAERPVREPPDHSVI